MAYETKGRLIRVGVTGVVFAAGFLCGSITHRNADAQLRELGKGVVEKAGESGGPLGSAVKLGEAIVEMQQHVDGLQKNIDILKAVKTGLGG